MHETFTPVRVGRYTVANCLVITPMTRSRARPGGTPGDLAAEYYAQRASVGLIVTEGTQPSDDGQGYLATPGIYTPAHIAEWKNVTAAVHDKGGRIFIQIMHVGRMSHPDNTPHHRQGVSSSAIAPGTQIIKNLIMTGGLLQIVANGAGAISVDNRMFQRRAHAVGAHPGTWVNPERL